MNPKKAALTALNRKNGGVKLNEPKNSGVNRVEPGKIAGYQR